MSETRTNWFTNASSRVLRFLRVERLWLRKWNFWQVVKVVIVVAACLFLLVLGAATFACLYPSSQVAREAPISNIVYLNQGWGSSVSSPERQRYYYTPQGTSIENLRYSWFVNLEMSWFDGQHKFTDPAHMRALGFLLDNTATPANPDHLPVGFTKHFNERLNEDVLDITCAACHTGELQVVNPAGGERTAIRIDGGQAMHAFTSARIGQFGPTLLAAMTSTYLNPFKFDRLAHKVLGDEHYDSGKRALRVEYGKVIMALARQAWAARHLYPVEEGFGRTDAIGRISNEVFGQELDSANYRVANAPVSYPPVWDIWKFDWVQYTGSVAQPLARNIGESLGVGAVIAMRDPYGLPLPVDQRYQSDALIDNLKLLEETLERLKAPPWPEQILGKIDQEKASGGKELFKQHCAHCHEPCEVSKEYRAVQTPLREPDQPFWHLNIIPVQDIGTDPNAAMNFYNNRVDLTKSGLTDAEVRSKVRRELLTQQQREDAYYHRPLSQELDCARQQQLDTVNVKSASIGAGLNYLDILLRERFFKQYRLDEKQQEEYAGYGALDIPQVLLAYKARPLAGVWATAPYLHNGSVPSLYDLLLPAEQRPKKFFISRLEFDPVRVGIVPQPLSQHGFWFDTSISGNSNRGHEFRAGFGGKWNPGSPPEYGVIGPELTDKQRYELIEYLKIRMDDPAPACPVPQYPPPKAACEIKS